MAFRFKDKERPRGYTSKLGGMLHVSGGWGVVLVLVFWGSFFGVVCLVLQYSNHLACLIILLINTGICKGPLHFLSLGR